VIPDNDISLRGPTEEKVFNRFDLRWTSAAVLAKLFLLTGGQKHISSIFSLSLSIYIYIELHTYKKNFEKHTRPDFCRIARKLSPY